MYKKTYNVEYFLLFLLYLAIETDIHMYIQRTPSAVAPNEIFNKEILNFIWLQVVLCLLKDTKVRMNIYPKFCGEALALTYRIEQS